MDKCINFLAEHYIKVYPDVFLDLSIDFNLKKESNNMCYKTDYQNFIKESYNYIDEELKNLDSDQVLELIQDKDVIDNKGFTKDININHENYELMLTCSEKFYKASTDILKFVSNYRSASNEKIAVSFNAVYDLFFYEELSVEEKHDLCLVYFKLVMTLLSIFYSEFKSNDYVNSVFKINYKY